MLFAEISEVGWAAIASMFASALAAVTTLAHAIFARYDAARKDEKLVVIDAKQEEIKSASATAADMAKRAAEVAKTKADMAAEQGKSIEALIHKTDEQTMTLNKVEKQTNGVSDMKHSEIMKILGDLRVEVAELKRAGK